MRARLLMIVNQQASFYAPMTMILICTLSLIH